MNKSRREQLVSTWRFVSTRVYREDGSNADLYGPTPNGIVIFTAEGFFALINTRPGRPKFVAKNSAEGTPEENKMTVLGMIAYFGTYSVDEAGGTFSILIQGSSFPNDEGTQQTRKFSIDGDRLTFVNPAPTVGGLGVRATLERAKLP